MTADRRKGAATIYAVAELAGVSIATVSRALKHPDVVSAGTRQRVLEAAAELDYQPDSAARSLAGRRHDAHGLILPELTGYYYADLLAGYESVASEHGQSVVLVVEKGKADIGRAARDLATRVDGIAVMGAAGLPRAILSALSERMPLVVIAGEDVPGAELVRTESYSVALDLTGRLLDAGRSRLRFVGDPASAEDVAARYAGFVQAHSARGMVAEKPLRVALDEASGDRMARDLIAGDMLPDGLVCANDLLALVILDRFRDAGIEAPRDVAITGWDDIAASRYVRPRLTTVRQPTREMAALAARRLHERITGDVQWGATHIVPTTLVVRESCGTAHHPRGMGAPQ